MLYKLPDLAVPVLLIGLTAALCGAMFKLGEMSGASDVRTEWAREIKSTNEFVQGLQTQYAAKEAVHRLESKRISDELASTTAQYQASLVQLESAYAQRLLDSNKRAEIYKRQAKGGAAERDSLAEHAANLDRSLEEGRRLVKQLRDTLEQRELAIGVLGNQILLDRNVFSESSDGTNGSVRTTLH